MISDISPHAAKKVVSAYLSEHRISFTKLSARTIGFQDLARANCVFVKIEGVLWIPETWAPVKELAVQNGFRVE